MRISAEIRRLGGAKVRARFQSTSAAPRRWFPQPWARLPSAVSARAESGFSEADTRPTPTTRCLLQSAQWLGACGPSLQDGRTQVLHLREGSHCDRPPVPGRGVPSGKGPPVPTRGGQVRQLRGPHIMGRRLMSVPPKGSPPRRPRTRPGFPRIEQFDLGRDMVKGGKMVTAAAMALRAACNGIQNKR